MRYLKKRRWRIILYVTASTVLMLFLPSVLLKIYINSSIFREELTSRINEKLNSERLYIVYDLGEIGLFSGIEIRYIRIKEKERQIADVRDCYIKGLLSKLLFGENDFTIRCENATLDLNYIESLKGNRSELKSLGRSSKYSTDFTILNSVVKYGKMNLLFKLSGRFSNNEKYLDVEQRDRYRIRITDIDLANRSALVSFENIDLPFVLKDYLGEYDNIVEGRIDGSVRVLKVGDEVRFNLSEMRVKNMFLKHRLIGEKPLRISMPLVEGMGNISLISGLLRVDEMRIGLGNMVFSISGRFLKGGYFVDFKTERLNLNDLATFFEGEEMEGFDMNGEIRLRLSLSGNINKKRKIEEISIMGEVYKPEQLSKRLNYLKRDFVYDFVDRNNKKKKIFIGAKNPDYIPLADLPIYVYGAVVASEDAGFFGHRGVEFKEIESAIIDNIEKERPYLRGGSTITQQIVKNLFLTKEKTLLRKMKELLLAIEMDASLSKERILEVYLNGIEWGPDIFGIGHASRHYFGKSPKDLRPVEAAYLASIIPNPNRYYSYYLNDEVRDLWYEKIQNILYRMNLFGFLSDEEYNKSLVDKVVFDRSDNQ